VPWIPEPYADVVTKAIVSVVILVLAVLINRVVGRVLRFRVKDRGHMHTLRMLARNTVIFVSGLIVLLTWLGLGSDFTVAMGILGAGIAFASQEVIGSFAGYLNIVTGNLYHIGDRVRIGNVIGDVLDITILRTVVMEMGAWVRADQYTGRVVTVANRTVFSDPVFNYS
jgi:small-conductance mechanosensitive channel